MCTKKESKIFKEAVNQIPVRKSIKINFEIPAISLIEEDFPIKDRFTSRKHNASKRKAKERNRSRKATVCQRDMNLYYAGLDRNGQTFKVRSIETSASLDEADFLKGDVNITESNTETNFSWFYVFDTCHTITDVINKINRFKEDGISFDIKTEEEILNMASTRYTNRKRVKKLFNQRRIVGYDVYYYSQWGEGKVGSFPTEEFANEYISILKQDGYEAVSSPVYMFSEYQAEKLIALESIPN